MSKKTRAQQPDLDGANASIVNVKIAEPPPALEHDEPAPVSAPPAADTEPPPAADTEPPPPFDHTEYLAELANELARCRHDVFAAADRANDGNPDAQANARRRDWRKTVHTVIERERTERNDERIVAALVALAGE